MELSEALKEHFGYDTFRKGQEAIVRSVLSGRPTIAILPTGGGKRLCYHLPALLREGTTVVVSPLVALMKDQVDALRARGIAATFVNSSLPESERQDRQGALRRGEYRLVYVAPERFKSPSFLSAMADLTVPLLAVDEAHCISAWGHDFRPEYQQLARAREQVRAERVLALTATATPEVRRDIADALELRDPRVFVAGFDRPNLFIEVLRVTGDKDKLGRLVALARGGGPGIVYAATRRNVEKIVAVLREAGVAAAGYHAGMDAGARTVVQDGFLRGAARVSAPELSGTVRLLESAGHLERGRSRAGAFVCQTPAVGADQLAIDFELLELRVARERQMLERLVRFADTRGCRRHNLLRYFGDDDSPRSCDACESCKGSRAPEPEEVTAAPRKRKQTEDPS